MISILETTPIAIQTAGLRQWHEPSTEYRPPAPLTEYGTRDGWNWVREQFNCSRETIHMSGLLLASHPRPVRDAILRHRRGLDEDPVHYLHSRWAFSSDPQHEDAEEKVLQAAARYLEANPDEIALTDSTTMGLGLIYSGIRIPRGGEILTSRYEHIASQEAVRLRTERDGVRVKTIPLYEDSFPVTEEQITSSLMAAVTERTRIIATSWVHSTTGVKLPIRRIAEEVRAINAQRPLEKRILLCVDGVHGFGIEDATVDELGCDFLITGCHKWLFGPRGTGIVWGRSEAWSQVVPMIPSFSIFSKTSPGRRMTPGGFHSFEHRWALEAAFDFHMEIGKRRIQERIHALNSRLKRGLLGLRNVRLHTPVCPSLSSGIVCFAVEGWKAEHVVEWLEARRITATTTPVYEAPLARLTPGLLNHEAEVDRVLEAIAELARINELR